MLDHAMSSPPHAAGQLHPHPHRSPAEQEPPRTVERKRKGRMVDVVSFLPTPPRTRDTRHDPSPQRPCSKPAAIRRRPGLTFAQQMGQHGPGVGMGGGMRGALIPAAPIVDPSTANPFLAICSPPPETKPSIMPPSPTPMLAKGAVTPTQTVPLPSPPPTVKRVRRQRPTLPTDEESNPFYCAPGKASSSSSTASALVMAQRQEARRRMEQSETITYVHRGAKRVFANPFYPSSVPHPPSTLPERDERFSPHPNPQPKLLFPDPPALETDELQAVPRRLFGVKRVAEDEIARQGKRVRGAF